MSLAFLAFSEPVLPDEFRWRLSPRVSAVAEEEEAAEEEAAEVLVRAGIGPPAARAAAAEEAGFFFGTAPRKSPGGGVGTGGFRGSFLGAMMSCEGKG